MKEFTLKVRIDDDLMKVFVSKCLSCTVNPEQVITDFIKDVAMGDSMGVGKEYFFDKWYPDINDHFISFGQFLYRENLEEEYKLATEHEYASKIKILFGLDKEKPEAEKKLLRSRKVISDLYKRYVEAMSRFQTEPIPFDSAIKSVGQFEERVDTYKSGLMSEEEKKEEE